MGEPFNVLVSATGLHFKNPQLQQSDGAGLGSCERHVLFRQFHEQVAVAHNSMMPFRIMSMTGPEKLLLDHRGPSKYVCTGFICWEW